MEHCGQLIRQRSSSCCSTIGLLLIYAQMLLRLFRWSSIGEWEALPYSGSATTMTAILARVLIQSFQGKPPTYVGWSTVIYTYLYHWPCVSPSTLGRAITERRDTGIQLDLFSPIFSLGGHYFTYSLLNPCVGCISVQGEHFYTLNIIRLS